MILYKTTTKISKVNCEIGVTAQNIHLTLTIEGGRDSCANKRQKELKCNWSRAIHLWRESFPPRGVEFRRMLKRRAAWLKFSRRPQLMLSESYDQYLLLIWIQMPACCQRVMMTYFAMHACQCILIGWKQTCTKKTFNLKISMHACQCILIS